jgi:hypothetical protein
MMESSDDRTQEAAEERAKHEATEERKSDEAAERGPAQEAVSEDGAATRAADALTEGGAADTAAKGAHQIAAAPKDVSESAADATKKVSGDIRDVATGSTGDDDATEGDEPEPGATRR